MIPVDDLLDDLFNGCALAAYLDQAAEERGWPDSEKTRRRAYRYYEEELAKRNRQRDSEEPQHRPRCSLAKLVKHCNRSKPASEVERT